MWSTNTCISTHKIFFKNSDTAFLKECFNKKRQTSLQILMNK